MMDGGWSRNQPSCCFVCAASKTKDATRRLDNRHLKQTERCDRVVLHKVMNLLKVLKDMGNVFREDTGDLLSLDTKDIAHPTAA